MRVRRAVFFLGCLAAAAGVVSTLGAGSQPQSPQADIWQEEPAAPQQWWYRWLNDETIDRIMKGIQQRDPAKANELAELRKKNLDEFKKELGEHGRQEIDQISREWFEARRQKDLADFLDWLKANYAKEAEVLSRIKEKDPQLYAKSCDRLMTQFGPIFQADKSNPELGTLLKEDFDLKKRQDDLVQKIRSEKSQGKKQTIGSELQDVISRRYDLIVRRKEIAFAQLQKKLESLQKQIQDNQNEIGKWKDPRVRQQNVQQRIDSLTEGKIAFKWD